MAAFDPKRTYARPAAGFMFVAGLVWVVTSMKSAFVERRFDLEPDLQVTAVIFAAEERDGCFRCDYVIAWPDRQQRFHAAGIDGFQALLHALMHVEVNLTVSQEYKEGKLTWLGDSYLGLPSTKTFSTAPPAPQ